MTPPDSGEREVIESESDKRAALARIRELLDMGATHNTVTGDEVVRLSVAVGKWDRANAPPPPVPVPLPLAQRILAALETGMAGTIGEAQKQIALASELRAAVERKP